MERGVRLIGNGQAPVHMYWKDLLKKIQTGELEPLHMLSHRVPIDDMAEVYKKYDQRMEGMQKIFVETKFSDPPAAGAPKSTSFKNL